MLLTNSVVFEVEYVFRSLSQSRTEFLVLMKTQSSRSGGGVVWVFAC